MNRFRVTYDRISEESAADGEAYERGWCIPGGWHFPIESQPFDDPELNLTLRQAASLVGCVEDGGRAFYEIDGEENYTTGDREYKAVHPPANITPASYRRVARVLGVRSR